MAVPNIFANATTSIPLSQLDQNFATAITLGNTAVYLGNTTTTIGNLTLANVTITSGTSNIASNSISNGTSNVTIGSANGAISLATNGNTAVTIDTNQFVGIGTTTPGSNSGKFQVAIGDNSGWYGNFGNSTVGVLLGIRSNTASIGTNGATNLILNPDGGYTLINTTARTGAEQVSMRYSSNTGPGMNIRDTNPQNGNTFIQFNNGATTAGTITSNGSTTMTYGSASDYRLKSNPQKIKNALSKVLALNPVSFVWNQTGEQGIGFIAHEVQEIFPDCVVGKKDAEDKDGNPIYQMIDTGSASLIAALTSSIQELKAQNDELAARVLALEGK